MAEIWGRVTYQRKKPVANEKRPSVFASVPQSVFLVAASKTDVASKTEFLQAFGFYFTSVLPFGFFIPSVFRGLVLGIRFMRLSEDV